MGNVVEVAGAITVGGLEAIFLIFTQGNEMTNALNNTINAKQELISIEMISLIIINNKNFNSRSSIWSSNSDRY